MTTAKQRKLLDNLADDFNGLATVKVGNANYDINLRQLTVGEKMEARDLLGVATFSTPQLISDEIGHAVLAYLAVKRSNPSTKWAEIEQLPGDQIGLYEFEDTPLDDGSADTEKPAENPSTDGSAAKSSKRRSTAA